MTSWLAFWLCLAGVFGVAAALTRSVHVLVFSVAAAAAAGVAYAELPEPVQWGAYAVLTVVLLFVVDWTGRRLRPLRRAIGEDL